MTSSKRKQFNWFVREVCARLNAPLTDGVDEWFYQPEENPMRPDQADAYLQGRQQQLRDHIWCGLPVRALEVRREGTTQQCTDSGEIIVTYRIREIENSLVSVEFRVPPLPAGQVAQYFASLSSNDAAELKEFTRGGPGKCFLDPTHWVNRVTALSWHHLSPCILSSPTEMHVNLIDKVINAGPGDDEAHDTAFKMPKCGTFTQEFIDAKAEEIGPLLNVLRDQSDDATLYLGVGDGEIGTKGVVLGASTRISNTIPELVWYPPKIFPPLLEEEVSVEALTLKRPTIGGCFIAVTSEKIFQDAMAEVDGHCWIVREKNEGESIVGVMFDVPLPQKYAATSSLKFDEQIHSVEDRYVIRIRVQPSEEARVGTHALLHRIGVLYQPPSLFPSETHRLGQFDPLLAWLRLQTVQPSLQAWFVNDTNLKVVFTPSYIRVSKLLHCQLPASFHEVNDENHSLFTDILSNHTVVTRFAIVHLDRWSRTLRGVIQQDIKQYRTTWTAVLLVPLNIKLAKLQEIVRDMRYEQVKILGLLPVGLKQRLFPPTSFSETWKNEWTEHELAEPILHDLSVTTDYLRRVFASWIFPEHHVERGPPSWELVANGYVIRTTAAKCLFETIGSALMESSLRIHIFSVVPDSTFPICGKTCTMRRVAWDFDKQYVVLWMTNRGGFITEFVNGIQRAMQQSQKGVVVFCDFPCPEGFRITLCPSMVCLPEKIVFVFSESVQSPTPNGEEIPVSAIWDIPELKALGKKLSESLLSGSHAQTQNAVDEALKYSEEDRSNRINRHFFMLVLAAVRGHFVPAWKWVDRARRETKELGDALALLRVTAREDYWKVPLNDSEQPCDIWVACQPPSRDTRRWFAFAHPFLACLHLHLTETGLNQLQNKTISLIEDLPSPSALLGLWETTTDIISSRLIDARVQSIVHDVLQTRRAGQPFSRFSRVFLEDPRTFERCINLPRNNRLRLGEPHASVLVSRVYREAGWFYDAWGWAYRAREICPPEEAALLALTRSNAATVVAKMAVRTINFEQAFWAYGEFSEMLSENTDLLQRLDDQKKASEIREQISRIQGQMDFLVRHFPDISSDDAGEEYLY